MKGVKTSSSANSLLPPIRQTASIFKQPVTVVKVSEENNVKTDPGTKTAKTKDKPRQLFWEKRLDGISAQNPEDALLGMELPRMYIYAGPDGSKFPISSRFRYLRAYHYLQIHAKKMHY